MAFSSLHMHNLLLVLLGIADVKHSMTFGNINKPLKVLLQLDPLTCCPEVELSLTEEAFYGLSGDEENHCLSFSSSLSSLFHSLLSWEQWRKSTAHSGAPEEVLCPREWEREPQLGSAFLLCLFLIKKCLPYPKVWKINNLFYLYGELLLSPSSIRVRVPYFVCIKFEVFSLSPIGENLKTWLVPWFQSDWCWALRSACLG